MSLCCTAIDCACRSKPIVKIAACREGGQKNKLKIVPIAKTVREKVKISITQNGQRKTLIKSESTIESKFSQMLKNDQAEVLELSLGLPEQYRCKCCGKKIKEGNYGPHCKKIIINKFKRSINHRDWKLIEAFLKEGL